MVHLYRHDHQESSEQHLCRGQVILLVVLLLVTMRTTTMSMKFLELSQISGCRYFLSFFFYLCIYWSLSWGCCNRAPAKEVIALIRCNKSKSFLLSRDVCFLSICFSVPVSFSGLSIYLLAYHCSLARYNSSFSSLSPMYTSTLP